MKRLTVQVALLILAGFSASVSAFHPLITDDTGTQGRGGNQLESLLSADRKNVAGNIERVRILPIVYSRGVTETVDLFAGLSYARVRTSSPEGNGSGGSNPLLGAKWRFYENEESKTSLAVKPEVLFPVSSDREGAGLGKGETSGSLTLILSQEAPFGAIHVNIGAGRDRYRDSLNNPNTTTTRASIAPVWNLNGQWKLALDLGTESAHSSGTRVRSSFLELGAIYALSRDLEFALGIVRSIDNHSPRTTTHTATVGMTWRF